MKLNPIYLQCITFGIVYRATQIDDKYCRLIAVSEPYEHMKEDFKENFKECHYFAINKTGDSPFNAKVDLTDILDELKLMEGVVCMKVYEGELSQSRVDQAIERAKTPNKYGFVQA